MKDYLLRFEKKQKKSKSENTVEAYLSDITRFLDFLKSSDRKIHELDDEIMEKYINKLLNTTNMRTKKFISPRTVNRHIASIKAFITFLNTQDDFNNKIFIEIKSLKVQNNYYLENLLKKNEFVRMAEKAVEKGDYTAEVVFKTLYYTGARVSEMLSMKPKHISEDILRIKGKGDKYRDIILADDIIEVLEKYIRKKQIGYDQQLFPVSRQTIHNWIKKYAGLCRINLKHASAHKFRHLHAIDLLDNGASLPEVADELGHTDINVTRIYTKKDKKELKRTVNRLSMRK